MSLYKQIPGLSIKKGRSIAFSLFILDIPGIDFLTSSRCFFIGLFLLGKGDDLLILGLLCMSKMDVIMESCVLMRVGRFHTCGHNCNEYSKSTLKLPILEEDTFPFFNNFNQHCSLCSKRFCSSYCTKIFSCSCSSFSLLT